MLPVRNWIGGLLTLKERYWPELWTDPKGKAQKSRTLAGRGSHLYPALGDPAKVVLCAGEMDALTLGQALRRERIEGVEAVSATSGVQVHDRLLTEFDGRAVAVVFDVGEEDSAASVSARLREAGANAWPVRLPLPRRSDDINDWLVSGRSARELWRVIRRAKGRP